jgi:hypothetical protein
MEFDFNFNMELDMKYIQEVVDLLTKNAREQNDNNLKLLLNGGFFESTYDDCDLEKTLKCKKELKFDKYSSNFLKMYQKTFYIRTSGEQILYREPEIYHKYSSSSDEIVEMDMSHKTFKGEGIISVKDEFEKLFYVYINLDMINKCLTCDGNTEVNSKIVYSDDLVDLIQFTHTHKDMEDIIESFQE